MVTTIAPEVRVATQFRVLLAAGALCLLSACGGDSTREGIPATPCGKSTERVAGSGFVVCESGLVHRPTVGTCLGYQPSTATRPPSPEPDKDECTSDLDCTARPYGYCESSLTYYSAPVTPNRCAYGCTSDTECDPGNVCVCTEERGECRTATCQIDADCGPHSLCTEYLGPCGYASGLACQTQADRCQLNSDCPQSPLYASCVVTDQGFRDCVGCGG